MMDFVYFCGVVALLLHTPYMFTYKHVDADDMIEVFAQTSHKILTSEIHTLQ